MKLRNQITREEREAVVAELNGKPAVLVDGLPMSPLGFEILDASAAELWQLPPEWLANAARPRRPADLVREDRERVRRVAAFLQSEQGCMSAVVCLAGGGSVVVHRDGKVALATERRGGLT
jgi:hypothetical protein